MNYREKFIDTERRRKIEDADYYFRHLEPGAYESDVDTLKGFVEELLQKLDSDESPPLLNCAHTFDYIILEMLVLILSDDWGYI